MKTTAGFQLGRTTWKFKRLETSKFHFPPFSFALIYCLPISTRSKKKRDDCNLFLSGLSLTPWGSSYLYGLSVGEFLAIHRFYHEQKFVSNAIVKCSFDSDNKLSGTFRSTYQAFTGHIICMNSTVPDRLLKNQLKIFGKNNFSQNFEKFEICKLFGNSKRKSGEQKFQRN